MEALATPLSEVTFVVLDLETTGGSAHSCAITEVGALKLRGGECLGTFQTLVNPGPGVRLPPEITYLTGITESMVAPAPPIDSVLPAFAEFIGDAVIVGHNVRFDLGFLRANLARLGYPSLTNRFVDTYALARRLVRDELPDCKLRTLARHFRTTAQPCHRALDDARATGEVLHGLLERTASLGVLALDDLLALPATSAHPQVAKLRWVAPLPREPGVYLFKDITGRVLYVGRATDLRRRVRSHFASDDRRRIGPLLREAASLDHIRCANELEAAVLEVRLVHEHLPRYNGQVKAWRTYRYLEVDGARRRVVRVVKPAKAARYVGPLPAAKATALATGGSLGRTVVRQRRLESLVLAGRIEVELAGSEGGAVIEHGRLVETWGPAGRPARPTPTVRPARPTELPLSTDAFLEASCIAAWLDARAHRLRVVHSDGPWAWAWPAERAVDQPSLPDAGVPSSPPSSVDEPSSSADESSVPPPSSSPSVGSSSVD